MFAGPNLKQDPRGLIDAKYNKTCILAQGNAPNNTPVFHKSIHQIGQ